MGVLRKISRRYEIGGVTNEEVLIDKTRGGEIRPFCFAMQRCYPMRYLGADDVAHPPCVHLKFLVQYTPVARERICKVRIARSKTKKRRQRK